MASSGGRFKIRKMKWNSMRAANRIPEVALEQKMSDIRRFHAQFKRDAQQEEGKLWEYLYEEAEVLKTSLAKNSMEDVLDGTVSLKRTWVSESEAPLPYSESYRQFIIFKAQLMVKLFGRTGLKSRIRPRYNDLYELNRIPRENNQSSYDQLIEKHLKRLAADEKTLEALGTDSGDYPDNDEEDLASELETARRRSRAGSRVRGGLMQARPHHKRGSAKGAPGGSGETGEHQAAARDAGHAGDGGNTRRDEGAERGRNALESLPPLVKPERDLGRTLPPLDEGRTETEIHLPEI